MSTYINTASIPVTVQFRATSSSDVETVTVMPGAQLEAAEIVDDPILALQERDTTPPAAPSVKAVSRQGKKSDRSDETSES